MTQEMNKNDAMLHLIWTVAIADKKAGEISTITPEENNYLEVVCKKENIIIDWDDFNAKRKSLDYNKERIIDESCEALQDCDKDWKIRCLGYMQRMAWISREDDLENNMSDKEWSMILRAQKELDLTAEERKNSPKNLPSGK
jgi:hypothetical protein